MSCNVGNVRRERRSSRLIGEVVITFKDLLHLSQRLAFVLVQDLDQRLVLDPAVIHDAAAA